jgi:hypothetical protein
MLGLAAVFIEAPEVLKERYQNNEFAIPVQHAALCNASILADAQLTVVPTSHPSSGPANSPINVTVSPTIQPSIAPTAVTVSPTIQPSMAPTAVTVSPTIQPSIEITVSPTILPSIEITVSPTILPSIEVTASPTSQPSIAPAVSTVSPARQPSLVNSPAVSTVSPTRQPLKAATAPTSRPSPAPTSRPTSAPTSRPSPAPTSRPSPAPTSQPTSAPTSQPTSAPVYSLETLAPTRLKRKPDPKSKPKGKPKPKPVPPETINSSHSTVIPTFQSTNAPIFTDPSSETDDTLSEEDLEELIFLTANVQIQYSHDLNESDSAFNLTNANSILWRYAMANLISEVMSVPTNALLEGDSALLSDWQLPISAPNVSREWLLVHAAVWPEEIEQFADSQNNVDSNSLTSWNSTQLIKLLQMEFDDQLLSSVLEDSLITQVQTLPVFQNRTIKIPRIVSVIWQKDESMSRIVQSPSIVVSASPSFRSTRPPMTPLPTNIPTVKLASARTSPPTSVHAQNLTQNHSDIFQLNSVLSTSGTVFVALLAFVLILLLSWLYRQKYPRSTEEESSSEPVLSTTIAQDSENVDANNGGNMNNTNMVQTVFNRPFRSQTDSDLFMSSSGSEVFHLDNKIPPRKSTRSLSNVEKNESEDSQIMHQFTDYDHQTTNLCVLMMTNDDATTEAYEVLTTNLNGSTWLNQWVRQQP